MPIKKEGLNSVPFKDIPVGFVEEIPDKTKPHRAKLIRPSWHKYGLWIYNWRCRDCEDVKYGIECHDKVQKYLDKYPFVQWKYKNDQTGELGYFDILKLAEQSG